jgi:hypothetical protein
MEWACDDWVMLAEGVGDGRPNWVKIVFDPGGYDLAAQNGWIWDKKPKILGGACGVVDLFISRVCTTE